MLLLDALAENRISAAINDGAFDDLAGTGSPLHLDDDSAVPETLRVAYRILKNAGYLPPEQMLRREISQLETLLLQAKEFGWSYQGSRSQGAKGSGEKQTPEPLNRNSERQPRSLLRGWLARLNPPKEGRKAAFNGASGYEN